MFLPLLYIVTVPEGIAWHCFNYGQCTGPKSYHKPDLAAKDTFYSDTITRLCPWKDTKYLFNIAFTFPRNG